MKDRAAEAVDFALLEGLIKYTPQGTLAHAPFTLSPSPLPLRTITLLEQLTPAFNTVAQGLADDPEFLTEALAPAASEDEFLSALLAMARSRRAQQPLSLLVNRADYLMQSLRGGASQAPRLVELNTISAAYAGLSGKVNRLHRYLLAGSDQEALLIPSAPIGGVADAFAEAFRRYGHGGACCLMIIQPGERNIFDQRLLEFALRERGIDTERMALEQVATEGALREGHLTVRGRIAAITYLRAGYGPEDYPGASAWAGRELIESSSTVAVPDGLTQLAGAKKVQQRLTDPAVLAKYCPAGERTRVAGTFVGQFELEDIIDTDHGALPAWEAARDDPSRFVLKPQREGGGNNRYGEDMARHLNGLTAAQMRAYILMERIYGKPHPALTVMEGKVRQGACVSEIGRFGVLLADGGQVILNRDVGYLVRTKGETVEESGISAGFGYLDSLIGEPDDGD